MNDLILTKDQTRCGLIISGFAIFMMSFLLNTLNFPIQHNWGMFWVVVWMLGIASIPAYLVYLGFTRWMKIDLNTWWYNKFTFWKDILFGIFTSIIFLTLAAVGIFIIVLIATPIISALGLVDSVSSLLPSVDSSESSNDFSILISIPFLVPLLFLLVFTQEVVFRGFLLTILKNKFGHQKGNVLQGIIFGLFLLLTETPSGPWVVLPFALLFSTLFGIYLGWLREKTNHLVAPASVMIFFPVLAVISDYL